MAWHRGWDGTLTVPWYVLTAVGRGGQKGAASTVRANKCLVVKMSHMAFCMWRPLSFGRSPSPAQLYELTRKCACPGLMMPETKGLVREAGEGLGGPFYVKHAPKSYEFYYK